MKKNTKHDVIQRDDVITVRNIPQLFWENNFHSVLKKANTYVCKENFKCLAGCVFLCPRRCMFHFRFLIGLIPGRCTMRYSRVGGREKKSCFCSLNFNRFLIFLSCPSWQTGRFHVVQVFPNKREKEPHIWA